MTERMKPPARAPVARWAGPGGGPAASSSGR